MDTTPQIYTRYISKLKKRTHEYGDVYTFTFEKPEGLTFKSGNYAHVFLPTVEAPHRAVREISFASAPNDEEIVFTITTESKSPWQVRLLEVNNGDPIELFKIKGHLETPDSGTLVMIGNGIGVTPFRSIVREYFEMSTPVVPILIHIGKENYLYEQEFSKLNFEQHRITREEIGTTVDSVLSKNRNAAFMIAGSPAFVESMAHSLLEKSVWASNIQTDAFKGLPD